MYRERAKRDEMEWEAQSKESQNFVHSGNIRLQHIQTQTKHFRYALCCRNTKPKPTDKIFNAQMQIWICWKYRGFFLEKKIEQTSITLQQNDSVQKIIETMRWGLHGLNDKISTHNLNIQKKTTTEIIRKSIFDLWINVNHSNSHSFQRYCINFFLHN